MIDLNKIEDYLHEHIPITQHMGIRVIAYDGASVNLLAPLIANLNHRNTAFGGSVSALGILAGWTLLHIKMLEQHQSVRLVIQNSNMDFVAPIETDFHAVCCMPPPANWARFKHVLLRRGRGRVELSADLLVDGHLAGRHHGIYVAVRV